MHNGIESEEFFAVTSVKSVAVLHAGLKLVRNEARAQLYNKKNKDITSQRSKTLCRLVGYSQEQNLIFVTRQAFASFKNGFFQV